MNDLENISSTGEPSLLQPLVDSMFVDSKRVRQIDFVLRAEAFDLDEELMEVVSLLPPGTYSRQQFTDQLNSIITAHGWGMTIGTVS